MQRRFPLLLAVSWAVTACGPTEAPPAPGDPALQPPQSERTATVLADTAAPGAAVSVRFANDGSRTVQFNPCQRRTERREGTGWVLLPDELRLCTAVVYELRPGTSQHHDVDVPLDATPGVHRFRFPVTLTMPDVVHGSERTERAEIVSNSFSVR